MEPDSIVVEIRSQLMRELCNLASTPADCEQEVNDILGLIKSHLAHYSNLINSNALRLNNMQLSKIVLKIHQIIMEVSAEYHLVVSNNSYEAHALFNILDKSKNPTSSQQSQKSPLKVYITEGQSQTKNNEIFLNKDLILLAVTSRGSFNPYINAIFAWYLSEVGHPIKTIVDIDQLMRTGLRLFEDSKYQLLDEKVYKEYLETLVWGSTEQIADTLNELTAKLWFSVLRNDKTSLAFIEKLLVGLLGHADPKARDLAVAHLNSFYDDTDWQLLQPFKPKITTVGKEFVIRELTESLDTSNIIMELHAPGFHKTSSNYILSYHIPEVRDASNGYLLKVDLGIFTRCGFYDWRFSQIKDGVISPLMTSLARTGQTGFELFPIQGRFIVHPNDVKDLQIHEIFIDFQDAQFDVNDGSIVERGNFMTVKKSIKSRYQTGINCLYLLGALERDTGTDLENPNASPLALICRSTACTLLGGGNEFDGLMKEAKTVGMKILIDCVARISSKNYHRRYKRKFLYTRNAEGLPVVCYGSEGRSAKFEDSASLNYRMAEVWNILVEDIVNFARKYNVDGIHMDNSQAWPQIMELDELEMYRKDPDGAPHYTTQEIFDGLVVKRNANYAYWASSLKKTYPNPIFIKVCKELWREFPEFYIIADIWKSEGMEDRDVCITESGPIPRLYDLPLKLANLFGKNLHQNGTFDAIERKDVSIIKAWNDEMREKMPEGAIVIQSNTGHSLPYPALLYGRGAWAAVDVLFFLNYIPMTFIGEQDGNAFRSKISALYDFEEDRSAPIPSRLSSVNLAEIEVPVVKKPGIPRVASAASLSISPDIKELKEKEEKYQKELGPEYGFDLQKIKNHYIHRRSMRHEKDVLKYGELIPLVMKHEHGWHKQVLTFARYMQDEIAIVAINLNEHPVKGYLDLSALEPFIEKEQALIYSIGEWFNPDSDDYYFKEELLKGQHIISILPYRSEIKGIYQSDVSSDAALERSIERLKEKIVSGLNIDGTYLVMKLLKLLEETNAESVYKDIANLLGNINENFLSRYVVSTLAFLSKISSLDDIKAGRLFGYCDFLALAQGKLNGPKTFASSLLSDNQLGPIIFTCPELGRFSTAGGLGVMVDELSQGLASLGEEVWCISPYYERNKKGQSGYLTGDPANVTWITNLDITFGGEKYTIGVHQGCENGVNLIFLHNAYLFPTVYEDGKPDWVMRQLVAWGKGCLEALCFLKKIPSLLITNDWFTGLVAAYAKIGSFGNVFEGTTFLHIVHNLDPTYEGRLFCGPGDNGWIKLHGLPRDWLIDPHWAKEIVNPSRCALMMSDQWATVSPSYRNELLAISPLKELLKKKFQPFAYPNGIPVKARLKRLEGKGTHLDAKKALQQKYFNYGDLDNTVCLFGFVGRITSQKGVHLIIDAAAQLIPQCNYKVQFLVGGPANKNEPYSFQCSQKMKELRSKYPNNFFADPDNFFFDGPLVNLGSDFGLMPSMFEPGGIVQHEFFVAGTPVIAFKTGGLKDTVFEFNTVNKTGSGFIFESYNLGDFIFAIQRAINSYYNNDLYSALRVKAFEAVVDGEKVSRAWNKEFYRLKQKIYFEINVRREISGQLRNVKWNNNDYNPSIPENQVKKRSLKRSPSGILLEQAASMKRPQPESEDAKRHCLFKYQTSVRVKTVQLTGSFDRWQIRHPMIYDHAKGFWHITLQIPKGSYFYKFVVDGNIWVHSFDHPTINDGQGNINNLLEVS